MVKVGEICECIVPGRNKPKKFDGDIPWITTPDIVERIVEKSVSGLNITYQEAKDSGNKIIPKGSVIMSCVGEFGIVAISGTEITINQQLHAFVPGPEIDGNFLRYALLYQKPYMECLATKTSIPYLNKTNCNSIPIPKIDKKTQLRVALPLQAIESREKTELKIVSGLEALKKALMSCLLTGEIRVPTQEKNQEVAYA